MPGILFDHIAIAMPRMADATATLVGRLGGVPAYGMPSGASPDPAFGVTFVRTRVAPATPASS